MVSRVRSVTFEVAITAMHCLVFHESARTHPVDQLQIVAVDPGPISNQHGYLRLNTILHIENTMCLNMCGCT